MQVKKNKHYCRILIHTFCAKIKGTHFLARVEEIQNGVLRRAITFEVV